MTPLKSPLQLTTPPTLEKKLEALAALRTLQAHDEELVRQRRAEIVTLRRDFEALQRDVAALGRRLASDVRSDVLRTLKDNPDQPRVPKSLPPANSRWDADASSAYQKAAVDDPEHPGWPAGTPDRKGGQFRPKDGNAGGSSTASADGTETGAVKQPAASASNSHVAQIPPLLFENPLLLARPPFAQFPKDPKLPPGPGYEWRGQSWSKPGDPEGGWYNPKTRESLHPDMGHDPPIGPHWDYIAPNGLRYRWFPDGRFELNS